MKKSANKRYVIKDSGMILDLTTGGSYTVNTTGLTIFKDAVEGKKLEAILDNLCTEYAVDRDLAKKDIEEFLVELKVMGIYES